MFDWLKGRKASAAGPARLPAPTNDYDRAILGDIARIGWSVIQTTLDDLR